MSDAPASSSTSTAKTEAAPASTPASDSTAKTTGSGGKSASQTSISHFSSVSTPQYRSGWEAIFGGGKKSEAAVPDVAAEKAMPDTLTLHDADIDAELRAALDKAFSAWADKNGIDLDDVKRNSVLQYRVECSVS